MIKHFVTLLFLILIPFVSNSAAVPKSFDTLFVDSTLRIDYIFTGGNGECEISLDRLSKFAKWAGRRNHLNDIPLEGNGSATMTTLEGDTIFRTSFSTLFHEWLVTDEAQQCRRAFEHTLLFPYPQEKVNVNVTLRNYSKQIIASQTLTIDPNDILIRLNRTTDAKTRYIHKGGEPEQTIDVAIIGEGYTTSEEELFFNDASKAVESILSHSPFKEESDKFNFLAVFTPSTDSGVSTPRLNDWKDTKFASHFSTFYSDRYLTTNQLHTIHDALSGLPYEHIIMLANTDEYGGGGIYNSFELTTAHNKNFFPVVTHEFGHSFGGLGDEYFYDDDVMTDTYPLDAEPWEPNITTLIDFDSKWKEIIVKDTPIPTPTELADQYPVGIYEGGGYSSKGIYRPSYDCRMRTNKYPEFCPACQRWLRHIIDFYTR
jgi:hypothetical protein